MGSDSRSRHHLKYKYPLWNQRLAALVCSGLYFGWLLLFTPNYGMRSGLSPDRVLAVAKVFRFQVWAADGI
jgi:hypothetical protein